MITLSNMFKHLIALNFATEKNKEKQAKLEVYLEPYN
jgi:hypothetical protein